MIFSIKPKIYHFHSSRERASKIKKILIYIVLGILLVVSVMVWQKKLAAIKNDSQREISQREELFFSQVRESLKKSDKNSFDLVVSGRKMLEKNNPDLALLYFAVASEKDPNYRDAYFYLGYSYLRVSESEQSNKHSDRTPRPRSGQASTAIEQLEQARDAFIKARDLDPLYAPTYEFLAYTYSKLGNEEEAQLTYQKAEELKN